jgi:hypothetical protein
VCLLGGPPMRRPPASASGSSSRGWNTWGICERVRKCLCRDYGASYVLTASYKKTHNQEWLCHP